MPQLFLKVAQFATAQGAFNTVWSKVGLKKVGKKVSYSNSISVRHTIFVTSYFKSTKNNHGNWTQLLHHQQRFYQTSVVSIKNVVQTIYFRMNSAVAYKTSILYSAQNRTKIRPYFRNSNPKSTVCNCKAKHFIRNSPIRRAIKSFAGRFRAHLGAIHSDLRYRRRRRRRRLMAGTHVCFVDRSTFYF